MNREYIEKIENMVNSIDIKDNDPFNLVNQLKEIESENN